MARHTKEYNEGYQAAIEALKKELAGQSQSGNDNGQNLPSDMTSPQEATGRKSNKKDDKQNKQSSGNSRTNPNDSSQGIVRPEDCCSNNSSVEGTPSTAGGFFDKNEGDKLAQAEGYDKDGGSSDKVADEWKDAALKAANKISEQPGTVMGNLKSALEGMYKVTTDWKKALRYVVGKSINDAEKRQAYANKNILISQDRIARTDKDKFDNMDYMIAWIDSSGSMSDEQLKLVLSECYSLALQKKPVKLITIQCDTKIQEIKEYTSLSDLKKDAVHATVKGRGGTDVKPLWDLLAGKDHPEFKRKHKGNPDLIMIFTDGYLTQYPRNKRLMNWLCWCIIDNPSFNVNQSDSMTKMIHLKSTDVK